MSSKSNKSKNLQIHGSNCTCFSCKWMPKEADDDSSESSSSSSSSSSSDTSSDSSSNVSITSTVVINGLNIQMNQTIVTKPGETMIVPGITVIGNKITK